MPLTHRQRLETAWRFEEPDRVPIEMKVSQKTRAHPMAAKLVEMIDRHADHFCFAPGADFGFLGLPTEYTEAVIEEQPGEFRRLERTHQTPAGVFTAVTYHPEHAPDDYHWEKRFILSLDEFKRVAGTPRTPPIWDHQAYLTRVEQIGEDGVPIMSLFHPLGDLVRTATMEEVYAWFREAPAAIHRYLAAAYDQVVATVDGMQRALGSGLTFVTWAHEMLIPPWMGHELFDEFVLPYDRRLCAAIHKHGGRLRAHCHGQCMGFLVKFADMGIDATEPLEPPPYADVDLAEAKRLVGDRMLLSGNIPSQAFPRLSPDQVRAMVRDAIRVAAPGGGFTLRTTGGAGGTSTAMPEETFGRVIANCEAYMEAGLEYGQYPIRTV